MLTSQELGSMTVGQRLCVGNCSCVCGVVRILDEAGQLHQVCVCMYIMVAELCRRYLQHR